MKIEKWLWIVAVLCAGAAMVLAFACTGDDDDDDNDDTGDDDTGDDDAGPDIPHDYTAQDDCLASGCHAGAHGGAFDADPIPDKCLECHS